MKKHIFIVVLCLAMVLMVVGCSQNNEANDTNNADVDTSANTTGDTDVEATDTVTVADLEALLADETVRLVDTRASLIYNGWNGTAGQIGGHIPGAVNFSAAWLDKFEDDAAIQAELERITVADANQIILYGEDSAQVAEKFSALGLSNIVILEDGMEAWAADHDVAKLANYQMLVHPAVLNDLLAGKAVAEFDTTDVKVFEASWGAGDGYEEGHIPGAVHINTDEFEEEPIWNRKSDEDIEAAILANGITKDSTVIVYGPDATPAARIVVILQYAGVEDVRLLDGGYAAWVDAGYAVETGKVAKTPVQAFGATVPVNKDYIIDMDEAKAILASDTANLISIRSWAEFIGETSGYSYIEPKGRIKGAVFGEDTSSYRNVDGTMFNYELMQKSWMDKGIDEGDRNAFYCGTGWRASETLFYADLMGWENISLYDGGWYEWSSIEENPTEVGEPQ